MVSPEFKRLEKELRMLAIEKEEADAAAQVHEKKSYQLEKKIRDLKKQTTHEIELEK